MASDRLYERIGVGYALQRMPDPRIAAQVEAALSEASTIVDVGAGTGNYEPPDLAVTAVEPSPTMIAQRGGTTPIVRAVAEHLPFGDHTFDAALAMFTLHHWTDRPAGLIELARVSDRQVILVYDTDVTAGLWLIDYFPELRLATWEADAPTPADVGEVLHLVETRRLLVPFDCTDGFTGAYWGRPEAYLRPEVQAGMSTLARLPDDVRAAGTERLRAALASGRWDERHGELRTMVTYDLGYRLALCAGLAGTAPTGR
jgi:SAM-dependent methyltransferase